MSRDVRLRTSLSSDCIIIIPKSELACHILAATHRPPLRRDSLTFCIFICRQFFDEFGTVSQNKQRMKPPHQRDDGWQRTMDTIDLTLDSSPDPDHKSLSSRQSRFNPDAKLDPDLNQPSTRTGDLFRSTDSRFKNELLEEPPKMIHPDHLRRIINTSDPRALREVVIKLCQRSPLLSGAVARGLSMSSTFVHSLRINGATNPSTRMPQDRRTDFADFERIGQTKPMKTEPGSISAMKTERLSPFIRQRTPQAVDKIISHTHLRPSPEMNPAISDSDTDEELRKPTPSKPVKERLASQASFRNMLLSPTGTSSSRPMATPTFVKSEPRQTVGPMEKMCSICGELVKDLDSEICMYHPDILCKQEDGTVAYNCCLKDKGEGGCEMHGLHQVEEVQEQSALVRQKRPSPGPDSVKNNHKRTRPN